MRLGNVGPIGNDIRHLVPESVAEASQAFAAAQERCRATQLAVREANATVKAGPRADRSAARAAELDSSPLPKPLLPKAEVALAEAKRERQAAEEAAVTRQTEYIAAVRDAYEEIKGKATAELGVIAEATAAALDQVEESLELGVGVRRLLKELGSGNYLGGRTPMFKPSRVGREAQHDALLGEPRERLDALRELLELEA